MKVSKPDTYHSYDLNTNKVTLLKERVKAYIQKRERLTPKEQRYLGKMAKNDLYLFLNLRYKTNPKYYSMLTKRKMIKECCVGK